MYAVVLVGGFGTRLRPLTNDVPKPVLPVAHRPMIVRLVERLQHAGVTDVVLALGFRPEPFRDLFPSDTHNGVRLHYAVEPEPLDTAGAIRFAADAAGNFSVPGIVPGTYQVAVKTANTLQKIVTTALVIGSNALAVGELAAGDADNDNAVTATDFSVLVTTFNLGSGAAGYDDRADFNGDDAVTALDFSLLATNYNTTGDSPVTGP